MNALEGIASTTRRFLAVGALAAASTLAACGGDGGTGTKTPTVKISTAQTGLNPNPAEVGSSVSLSIGIDSYKNCTPSASATYLGNTVAVEKLDDMHFRAAFPAVNAGGVVVDVVCGNAKDKYNLTLAVNPSVNISNLLYPQSTLLHGAAFEAGASAQANNGSGAARVDKLVISYKDASGSIVKDTTINNPELNTVYKANFIAGNNSPGTTETDSLIFYAEASGNRTKRVAVPVTVGRNPEVSITNFTATSNNNLQGDTITVQLDANAIPAPPTSLSIKDPSGTPVYQTGTNVGSLVAKVAANQTMSFLGTASKTGAADATQTISHTINPLSATLTSDKSSMNLGQTVRLTVNAPVGTDSVQVYRNGQLLAGPAVSGHAGFKDDVPTTANAYTYTAKAWNGTAVSPASTAANVTVNNPNYNLRVLLTGYNLAVPRAVLDVDGSAINVPQDTALILSPGSHKIGLRPTAEQPYAYAYGEITSGSSWWPVDAGNPTRAVINLNSDATISVKSLNRSEPNFSGVAKTVHDHVMPNRVTGKYQPSERVNYDVWIMEGALSLDVDGTSFQQCQAMTPESKAAWVQWVNELRTQERGGRVYTLRSGNPDKSLWVQQLDGTYKIAAGNYIVCDGPGLANNKLFYSSQGFLESGFAAVRGSTVSGKLSETKDWIDMNYDSQEDELNRRQTRHDKDGNGTLTGERSVMDTFTADGPMLTASKAARLGYGLLIAPR
jgi:hypothetical protein